uniref:Uncharacterized protein n=1 Tax=Romanomermis culicivorax TaxID=13658 RepID=A0A915L241_ROMCU
MGLAEPCGGGVFAGELLKLKDKMDKQSTPRFIVQKKMDNADLRSEEIHETVLQMIAVDDQPFSVVENPGFINFIKKVVLVSLIRHSYLPDSIPVGYLLFYSKNKLKNTFSDVFKALKSNFFYAERRRASLA